MIAKDLSLSFLEQISRHFKLDMGIGTATAISAGVTAASTGASAAISGKMNRRAERQAQKQRDFAREERELQNQWTLEQWNRENAYNSPEAQRDRLVAAGYSPLALLNGGAGIGDAAHAESAGDSFGSLPQYFNPADNIANLGASLSQSFLQFQQLDIAKKKSAAEIEHLQSDAQYKWSLKQTEDSLRSGKLDFLGVQIGLGKSQTKLADEQVKAVTQSIKESEKRCDQLQQWCVESGAKVDLMSWRKYCESRKLDKEIQLLGSEVILKNQQAIDLKTTRSDRRNLLQSQANLNDTQANGLSWDNRVKQDYVSSGQYKTDRKNKGLLLGKQVNISRWQADQLEGSTKSKALYTIDRGLDTTQKFINLFTSAFQGYMYMRVGNAAVPKQLPVSTPNPAGEVPTSQNWMP